MYRYRTEYMKDDRIHPVLIREHKEMVKALENRDQELVAREVRQHLKNQEEVMKKIIRDQG